MGRLVRRIGLLVRRGRFRSELEEERRLHREEMEREMATGGASEDEARRAARRRFGNETTGAQERSHEVIGFGLRRSRRTCDLRCGS